MNQATLERLISHLKQFLEEKYTSLTESIRKDRVAFHYYMEIIKFWNKINFILSSTISALKYKKKISLGKKSFYLLLIYQYIWEQTSLQKILKDFAPFFRGRKSELKKEQIIDFYNKLTTFSWKKALKNKSKLEKRSIKKAIPTFFLKRLLPYMSENFLLENIKAMNNQEDLDIGLFLIKHKQSQEIKEQIKKYLTHSNILYKESNKIDSLLTISYKNISKILETNFYKKSNILLVDKGSVVIAQLLANAEKGIILDMCAAPGIKTILLSNLTSNSNKIIASDFNLSRVFEMVNLLDFYKISDINILNTDSIDFPLRQNLQIDTILLDAPCSGSGTFSSNPELKWRQNRSFLYQNITLQEKLLNSAINMLKSGGILVYSTCSLYAEEGELQIKQFLDELIPLDLPEFFHPSYKINGKILDGTGRLFPAKHATKGFFVGKFKKKEK